jgi:glycosyltransferase involved in cell wall biosynthesis
VNILFFITSLNFEQYHRKQEIEAIENKLQEIGGEVRIFERPVFILSWLTKKSERQRARHSNKVHRLYSMLPLSLALKSNWLTKLFVTIPVNWQVRRKTKSLKGPVFNWIYKPDQYLYIKRNYIYLHYDNYASDPVYFYNKNSKYESIQKTTIRNSVVSLFTSNTLFKRYNVLSGNCYYYPNAIARSLIVKSTIPNKPDDGKRVIGFVGQIDQSFDDDLLLMIAKAYPKYQIVLIGPTKNPKIAEIARQFANIELLGYIEYEQLGKYLQNFSIGICPYKSDAFSQYRNPLKVYEYFSFGLPVITTMCDLSVEAKSHLVMAKDHDEFVSSIANLCDSNNLEKTTGRLNFAKKNGWDNRADFVVERLEQFVKQVEVS